MIVLVARVIVGGGLHAGWTHERRRGTGGVVSGDFLRFCDPKAWFLYHWGPHIA